MGRRKRRGLAASLAVAAAVAVAAQACTLTSGRKATSSSSSAGFAVIDDPGARAELAGDLPGVAVYSGDDGHIWSVAASGADRRQLTHATGGVDFDPHWAPDGKNIVFRSTRYRAPDPTGTGYDGILVVNADGTGERPVHPPGGGLFPNWTPDGTGIVFSSPRPDGTEGLFQVRPDGTDLRDLNLYAEHVEWSPDGRSVLLDREDPGASQNWEIWRSRADLSDLTRLTNDPSDDHLGPWRPDGARIAFSSKRGGTNDVWTMNTDGSDQRKIIGWPGAQSPQAWLADGRLLFVDNPPQGPPRWFVTGEAGHTIRSVPALAGIEGPIDWRPVP